MNTFDDTGLSPEQLKRLTLQFMGQHLTGDLKNLEQNIVAKNSTLQGMVLNPTAVISSIPTAPVQAPPQQPQPQLTVHPVPQPSHPVTAITAPPVGAQPVVEQQLTPVDTNQLEFNFETSPLSVRIFETLERLEKKLTFIEETLAQLTDTKKKD